MAAAEAIEGDFVEVRDGELGEAEATVGHGSVCVQPGFNVDVGRDDLCLQVTMNATATGVNGPAA